MLDPTTEPDAAQSMIDTAMAEIAAKQPPPAPKSSVMNIDSDSSDSDDESDDEMPIDERLARAESSKDAGNGAFRSGANPAALKFYEKALGILRKCKGKLGDVPAEHAVAHGKLLVSCHLNSAAAHNKLEAWPAAIVHATYALAVDGTSEKALFRRGFARARNGELEGSKVDLLAVLKINPKSRDALRELAAVKKKLVKSNASERKKMSAAFKRASLGGGMYGDKEEERKEKERKAAKAKEKRRDEFARENARREACCEPTIAFEDWEKEEKKKAEARKKEREEAGKKRAKEREEVARKRRASEAQAEEEAELALRVL